jgi:hypothetical protein
MPKTEYVAPEVIDLKTAQVEGVEYELDFTEDAWSYGAPPPWGEYKFKLFFDKDGILKGLEDPKDPASVYYQFNLIGKITEGEHEGVPVYTRVNTRIYRGKGISTMAGLLSKMIDVSKLPSTKLTPLKLAKYTEQVIKKEPVVRGELDWRGAYVWSDKDGKDQYENVFKHYGEFPVDPETKERLHVCMVTNTHTGGKAEVRAQSQITRFFGKGEKLVVPVGKNGTQASVGMVNAAEVPDLVIDSPNVVIHKPQAAKGEEEELSLILSE